MYPASYRASPPFDANHPTTTPPRPCFETVIAQDIESTTETTIEITIEVVETGEEKEADLENGIAVVIGEHAVGVEIEMNVAGAGIEMIGEATVIETIAAVVPMALTTGEDEEVILEIDEIGLSIQGEVGGTVGKDLPKHLALEMK